MTNVRFWHLADIEELPPNVRFSLTNGHSTAKSECLLGANNGHHKLRIVANSNFPL